MPSNSFRLFSCGNETFLEPGDEHRVELEPLRRVHGHELQRRPALGGLRLARLERGVREERGQRIDGALLRRRRRRRRAAIGASTARSASRRKPSRRVDELLEVLEAVLPVLFGAVVRYEAGALDDVRDTPPAAASRAVAARSDSISLTNPVRLAARLAADRRPRTPPATGSFRAARAASCSDSSVRAPIPRGGKLTIAQECAVVIGRRDEPQVRERMLHFGALEEPHPAIDAVRKRRVEQRVLQHARLRVRPVEDGDFGQREALVREPLCDVDDERGLVDGRTAPPSRAPGRPCLRSSTGSCRAASRCCLMSALARSRMWPCER